ncbi:FecCD family ABC transporter permease [Glutamicibacter protophormiae]|uniref:Iron complex transport system permease protein n=1 Tax=Glutamicibacter protophormiae TaxID=37930 RepID=A0ABS4XL39_GLUPR|nr:iron ABC transporter permease [Glutamicibacter protophormiae]MBP2397115.1 iron complex transport system permease protein [Glutamicibacter protophormiae]GGL97772.1 enterobactin ABC transporter permease [Glutamicibacter protophormiae]
MSAIERSTQQEPIRHKGAAARRASRVRTAALWMVLVLLATAAAYIFWGRDRLPAIEVLQVLGGESVPGTGFILMEDRLPRLVVGALAGAGLGLSGALFQRWLGNPLASPDVIGVGFGASAAAIAAMIVFGVNDWKLNAFALAGGLAVAAVIYWLSASGQRTGSRLILAGLAIGAVLQALIQFLLTQAEVNTASDAMRWLTGSLSASTWERAAVLGVGLGAVGVLALPVVLSQLKLLELGEDAAAALGLHVGRARMLLVFAAVALGAIPIAVTGPLAFVAFLAGPITAALSRGAIHVPLAGLTGATLVVVANFFAANLFAQINLPVGVITGAFGAPFLIWVLVRANSTGNGG